MRLSTPRGVTTTDLDVHRRRRLPLDPRLHRHRASLRPAVVVYCGARGHQRPAGTEKWTTTYSRATLSSRRQGRGSYFLSTLARRADRERPLESCAMGSMLEILNRRAAQARRRGSAEAPLRLFSTNGQGRQSSCARSLPAEDEYARLVAYHSAHAGTPRTVALDARRPRCAPRPTAPSSSRKPRGVGWLGGLVVVTEVYVDRLAAARRGRERGVRRLAARR